MRVLGISGSLRADSHNTELLRAAANLLPPGIQLEVFGGLAAIPPYSEDS
jgi:chromate reductase, NAD(P)H dehydrogenase (quinone)